MTEYDVEVGYKGKFTKHSTIKTFDTLAKAKQFAREELAKGNAVSVNKALKDGDTQIIALLGEKKQSKYMPNFSTIGKLKPLKQKSRASWDDEKSILKGVMD